MAIFVQYMISLRLLRLSIRDTLIATARGGMTNQFISNYIDMTLVLC
jgi:hypothetical protein